MFIAFSDERAPGDDLTLTEMNEDDFIEEAIFRNFTRR